MKMRIRGDTLRLRVTRGELERLIDSGAVEESIRFGRTRRLDYRLQIDPNCDHLVARMDEACISVALPQDMARDWASTERVSLVAEQVIDAETTLQILIEKDFACLVEREGEDDSDAFPHPDGGVRS